MKMSLKNPNTLGAIRKGCPQFRGGERGFRQKWTQMRTGGGGG